MIQKLGLHYGNMKKKMCLYLDFTKVLKELLWEKVLNFGPKNWLLIWPKKNTMKQKMSKKIKNLKIKNRYLK